MTMLYNISPVFGKKTACLETAEQRQHERVRVVRGVIIIVLSGIVFDSIVVTEIARESDGAGLNWVTRTGRDIFV